MQAAAAAAAGACACIRYGAIQATGASRRGRGVPAAAAAAAAGQAAGRGCWQRAAARMQPAGHSGLHKFGAAAACREGVLVSRAAAAAAVEAMSRSGFAAVGTPDAAAAL